MIIEIGKDLTTLSEKIVATIHALHVINKKATTIIVSKPIATRLLQEFKDQYINREFVDPSDYSPEKLVGATLYGLTCIVLDEDGLILEVKATL